MFMYKARLMWFNADVYFGYGRMGIQQRKIPPTRNNTVSDYINVERIQIVFLTPNNSI